MYYSTHDEQMDGAGSICLLQISILNYQFSILFYFIFKIRLEAMHTQQREREKKNNYKMELNMFDHFFFVYCYLIYCFVSVTLAYYHSLKNT